MTNCDHIAHRLAAGDALNDDQRAHAELCATCTASLDAQRTLTAIGRARAAVEPSPGFASRVASRAFERVAERRRNRIAGYALGTAGAVAMATMATLWWRAGDARDPEVTTELAALPAAVYPLEDPAPTGDVDDASDLVWLTDADRALAYAANWDYIEEPIAPYAALLGEVGDHPTNPAIAPVPPIPAVAPIPPVPAIAPTPPLPPAPPTAPALPDFEEDTP